MKQFNAFLCPLSINEGSLLRKLEEIEGFSAAGLQLLPHTPPGPQEACADVHSQICGVLDVPRQVEGDKLGRLPGMKVFRTLESASWWEGKRHLCTPLCFCCVRPAVVTGSR